MLLEHEFLATLYCSTSTTKLLHRDFELLQRQVRKLFSHHHQCVLERREIVGNDISMFAIYGVLVEGWTLRVRSLWKLLEESLDLRQGTSKLALSCSF